MSTIAYRDGTLAADSMVSGGDLYCGRARKIARSPEGWIGGGCGKASSVDLFLNWIERGADRATIPPCPENTDGLLVGPDGAMFWWGESGLTPFSDYFAALGSGAGIAYGAMEAGASAAEAVKAATRRDVYTKGPICTLSHASKTAPNQSSAGCEQCVTDAWQQDQQRFVDYEKKRWKEDWDRHVAPHLNRDPTKLPRGRRWLSMLAAWFARPFP